jgi:ADP-ribosylglycohydrolase
MKIETLKDKASACLLGVAIGDALGMPVETMWPNKILEATGGRGIEGFVPPIQKRNWDTKDLKAGTTTDDWQLTRVVAESVLEHRGLINPYFCVEKHYKALQESAFGWGKTTQQAIEAFGRGEYDPTTDKLPAPEPGKGCGNGVVMKIAPLAIAWTAISGKRPDTLREQVMKLGQITHPDIRASIAAYPVARMLQIVLDGHLKRASEAYAVLLEIIGETIALETKFSTQGEQVSDRLMLLPGCSQSSEALQKTVGCGFHALDTAAFSIGTFIRHLEDFRGGTLEAVNAGGDADTNASVVGALIGANCGLAAIPTEWRSFNPAFEEAVVLGRRLASLI